MKRSVIVSAVVLMGLMTWVIPWVLVSCVSTADAARETETDTERAVLIHRVDSLELKVSELEKDVALLQATPRDDLGEAVGPPAPQGGH